MQRAVALNRLRKVLGDSLAYRVDPKAPTPDEREAAQAALPAAVKEWKDLAERMEARAKVLLDADPEYRSLKSAYAAARKNVDEIGWRARHFKITVGTSNSLFFTVRAEGDSWEEIIAKLTSKKEKA